jgi:hypothetical protein
MALGLARCCIRAGSGISPHPEGIPRGGGRAAQSRAESAMMLLKGTAAIEGLSAPCTMPESASGPIRAFPHVRFSAAYRGRPDVRQTAHGAMASTSAARSGSGPRAGGQGADERARSEVA